MIGDRLFKLLLEVIEFSGTGVCRKSLMISVVICTYNRATLLGYTLNSLEQMVIPRDLAWELIIVDNNSSDDTRAVVEAFSKSSRLNVRYFFEGEQGLSQARNRAVKEAMGEILAFTDDDITVDVKWLWEIKSTLDQYDCVGVGGRIIPVWSCERPAWLAIDGPFRLMRAIVSFDLGEAAHEMKRGAFGANMAFRRKAFEKYGVFRADLGRNGDILMSGEETEFCDRLLRGRERLVYAANAVVYHPVEQHRVTKRYFQLWYYNYGRAMIRKTGIGEKTIGRFGIPRYLLRSLATNLVKWIITFNPQGRFYYKAHLYLDIGRIIEFYERSTKCD